VLVLGSNIASSIFHVFFTLCWLDADLENLEGSRVSQLDRKTPIGRGPTHGFLFSVFTLGVPAGVDAAEALVLSLPNVLDCVPGVGVEAAPQTFVSTLPKLH
jgi:hypothetical protein